VTSFEQILAQLKKDSSNCKITDRTQWQQLIKYPMKPNILCCLVIKLPVSSMGIDTHFSGVELTLFGKQPGR
jgi:hypothetical protein